MAKLRLCIFDMDGTVVNSLHSIAFFANRTLERFGLAPFPEDAYRQMVGNGAARLVRRMIDADHGTEEQYRQVLRMYNADYDARPLYLAQPYDGIPEALRLLRARGSACAILSNKPHTTAKQISDALFGSLMDACVGGRPGVPLKPSPEGVHTLRNLFGAAPEECLYFGDTGTDMQTAANAGLFSVGVRWGFRSEDELRAAHAGVVIAHPREIEAVVRARFDAE